MISQNDTTAVEFNDKGLLQLIKALKGTPPTVRVGIEDPFYAEIGARYEFGIGAIQQKSFLREPLTNQLMDELESNGVFSEENFKEVIKTGDLNAVFEPMAKTAESISREAFRPNIRELPCRNPTCPSCGISHPNCKCYEGFSQSEAIESIHGEVIS